MKGLLLFFQLVGLVLSRATSRKEDKPIPPEQDYQEAEVTVEGEEESLIPPQDVGSGGGLTTEEWKIVSLLQKIQTKYPKLPDEDRYEFLEKLSSFRDRFARTIGKVETLPENFDLNLPLLKGALELETEDVWVEEQQMPRASIDPFFLGSQPGAVDNIPLYDMVVKGKLPQAYQNPLSPEENEAMYLSRKIEESSETEEEMADSSLDNLDLSSLKKMGVDSATLTRMTKMKPQQRNRLVKKLLMSNVLKNLLAPPQAAYPVPSWYNPYAQQQQHQSFYPKLFSPAQYYQQGFSLPMYDERDARSFPETSWETPVADIDEDGLDLDFLRQLDNVPTGTKEDREMQAAYKLLGETFESIPFEDFHSVDVQLNLPYPQQTSLYPNLYHHPPSRRSRRHAGSFGGGLTDLELLAVTGGFKNNDKLLPLLALTGGSGPGRRRYIPRPVHRPPVMLAPPPMHAPPPPPMLAPPPPPMLAPPPPPIHLTQPPPMTLPPHFGYPSYLRNPGNYWGQADIINPHYSYSKMMYNNHLFNSVKEVDPNDNYPQS